MEEQRFFIKGATYPASDTRLQDALARIYETPERPRCMCVRGGVEMYVAKHRQYVVKRMPGTGNKHHPACASYEPEYGQSGLGELMGESVIERSPESEFKGTEASTFGRKVWIKHMPDAPLFIENKAWERIERACGNLFEARDADTKARQRVVLCALVYAKREHTYQIDTASFMLTTENWIPIEGMHEVSLIQVLIEQKRRFMKPLRYDARSPAAFPNAMLLDTGETPTPLHIFSEFMDAKDKSVKEKIIKEAGERGWVWYTDKPIPVLPAVCEYGRRDMTQSPVRDT